jgi:hypothetical protein
LRRQAQADCKSESVPRPTPTTRRDAATNCGWCGGPIQLKPTGRIPKWCSASCRQRAWEQKRAAESGRSAVRIVERVVTAPTAAERRDWPALLAELANQINQGRLYQREQPDVAVALDQVLTAYRRATR